MNTRIKILIIRLSALGDTIHTLPLASSLRDKYPDAIIDWIVEDKASYCIENNKIIDNVYIIKRKNKSLSERIDSYIKNIIKIRKQKYDIVIDAQQLFKSGIIMGLSGGKRKLSLQGGREFSNIFANEIIPCPRKHFDINYHVVKRNLEYAKYLGCEESEYPKFSAPEISEKSYNKVQNELLKNLDKNKKTLIIAPETTWDNKHWTVEGWLEVIKYFKNNMNIIYVGTSNENGLSGKITKDFPEVINLSSKTNLDELRTVFHFGDLLVSLDSGTTHLAWLDGSIKILSLFFATSENRTAPYGEKYRSLSPQIACHPCMTKKCKNKKIECISMIKPNEVIQSIKDLTE